MAVATKELDELDGEEYAMEVIPYGVLYKNLNDPIQVYNGKQFPPYGWKESMATVELKAKSF